MEKEDKQLISEYLSGDEESFTKIIDRYIDQINNFSYRLTGNRDEAEDITQDTFLKVWKNLNKYRLEENFKTWIFTIARNTAIDYLRKKKNFVFSDFENESGENSITDNLKDPAPLPDELIQKATDKKVLEKILKEIPFSQKEVLLLYYNEDLTFDEIGKVLNKSINTVKSQHRRALIKLREMLDKETWDAPKY